MQKTIIHIQNLKPEIVETTLVVSRFRFLRVGSRISELRVIILPGTQILKVVSWISDCSRFRFSFLKFTKINDKLKKGIIVGYQPEKIRRRRYEQKLYENDQYATQSGENESCFHYLCLKPVMRRYDCSGHLYPPQSVV